MFCVRWVGKDLISHGISSVFIHVVVFFKKHEAQDAEILRNIARLTLTNITGKITFFNTVMF